MTLDCQDAGAPGGASRSHPRAGTAVTRRRAETDEIAWRERSRELRRARIVRSMASLAGEHGFAGVSLASLCADAGVSRATFYELFESREACFLAVLEDGQRRAGELLCEALQGVEDWLEGLRTALAELLLFLDSEPALARVCVVEALAAGPWALERRELLVADFARLIVENWGMLAPPEPHPFTNVGVMASVLGIVQNHLLADRREPLVGLLGPLIGFAIAPYLDARAVAEEVERAGELARELHSAALAGGAGGPGCPGGPDPGGAVNVPGVLLDPRAHRARECFLYVADNPGASNRQIARAAGIARDTHISTMLARLARTGLLKKRDADPGGANAWTLTPEGQAVARLLRGRPSLATGAERSLVPPDRRVANHSRMAGRRGRPSDV